jgi:hypothetical protein
MWGCVRVVVGSHPPVDRNQYSRSQNYALYKDTQCQARPTKKIFGDRLLNERVNQ